MPPPRSNQNQKPNLEMKTRLLTFLTTLALSVVTYAHGDVEIGPNGGRVLDFSKNETMHGELSEKNGKLQIEILDKDLKPVALAEQELTATSGDRSNPEKL